MIDFRQAKLRDVNWWRRTNLLLTEVAREDEATVVHASYLYHLALVANGSIGADNFKEQQKKARETFNDFVACTHPWAERVRRNRQLTDMKQLTELYKRVVGDPDDPLTRQRWQRESEELAARAANVDPGAVTMEAVRTALKQAATKEKVTVVKFN